MNIVTAIRQMKPIADGRHPLIRHVVYEGVMRCFG